MSDAPARRIPRRTTARTAAPNEAGGASHRQRTLAALRKFRQVFQAVQRHYHWVESRCGVSGAQMWALYEIARLPGLRVGDLARAMSVHQSTASNLLERLEGRGLIRRERGGPDQRVVYLFPTPAGTELLEQAPAPARGVLQEALHHLPDASLDALSACLDQLLAQMAVKAEEAAMRPLSD